MNFSASGIPGGAFLCTFVLFGSFQNLMHDASSILCSLNHYLAKYAPERHILPSWGRPGDHIRRAGRCCGQGAPVCIPLPKSNGFESRTKVETLPKSKGHPLPKSRMILREKISGKVESGLCYALLFHDSGIYPVFLTISHGYLFQDVVLEGGIIIRVDVSFLMMTANRSRYSLIYFPLFLGLIPIFFWLKPSFGG